MLGKIVQYDNLPPDLQEQLEQKAEVTKIKAFSQMTKAELATLLQDAVGLIGVGQTIGADLLDFAPNLKATSTISVGYDHFDVDELTKRGIMLMHTPGVMTETTADTIFLLILGSARRATELGEMVRQGRWTKIIGPECFASDVYGKKLGIIGMGRIGTAVARRAYAGFNMEVLYYNRSVKEYVEQEFKARKCSLDELLADSDFVCVVLPLSDETHKMIGAAEFAKMKPSAFLINAGRGPIVDEAALVEALKNGTIKGAGLDVFEQEPLPLDSPLLQLPNVIALPHVGSATHETRYAMAKCAVDNLLAALESKSTVNCVNPWVVT